MSFWLAIILGALVLPYTLWLRWGRRVRPYHTATVVYFMEPHPDDSAHQGKLVAVPRDISTVNQVSMLCLDILQRFKLFFAMAETTVAEPALGLWNRVGYEVIWRFMQATRSRLPGVPGDEREYWAILVSEAYSEPYNDSKLAAWAYMFGFGRPLNKGSMVRHINTLIVARDDLLRAAADPKRFIEDTLVNEQVAFHRLLTIAKVAPLFLRQTEGEKPCLFRKIERVYPKARVFAGAFHIDWSKPEPARFLKAAKL